MADYLFTKRVDSFTGQHPDRLEMVVPKEFAWQVVKLLLTRLENGEEIVGINLYGFVTQGEDHA